MTKVPKWNQKSNELLKRAIDFQKDKKLDQNILLQKLGEIFMESGKIMGVDVRAIAFLEFCFYRAEGPYSPKFNYYAVLLKKIFSIYPPIKRMMNLSGAAAIANMTLGAKGNLKFEIADLYELKKVLEIWRLMGLRAQSISSIFKAVMDKKSVQEEIKQKRIFLLARLREIFPMYQNQYLSETIDLDAEIFAHYKVRFEMVIESYEQDGLSIKDMITKENNRILPVGVSRNNLLAFLIKKRHNFECQICRLFKTITNFDQIIEAHHITPLSEGGLDKSDNIIVLCKKHHQEAHNQKLSIEILQRIHIEYQGKTYSLNFN